MISVLDSVAPVDDTSIQISKVDIPKLPSYFVLQRLMMAVSGRNSNGKVEIVRSDSCGCMKASRNGRQ